MSIVVVFNLLINIFVCYLLFSICSATMNVVFMKYKLVAVSVLDGTILGVISLFGLPVAGEALICFALFSSSAVVLYYPIKAQKILLLELVLGAYILLNWGIDYLLKIVFFNVFPITYDTFYLFIFIRGLIVVLIGFAIYCFFKRCYKKKEVLDFVYDVEISLFGKRIDLKMLFDSGNSLYDNEGGGLPVIVVTKSVLEEKLGEKVDVSGLRGVKYSTIGGESEPMPILIPDKILVKKKGKIEAVKAVVGVIDKDFKMYDGLLHSAVV